MPCHYGDLILRVLDYIVTISFGHILYCAWDLFCNVWVCVCVGFVMCGCFGNMYSCIYYVLYCFVYVYLFLFVLFVPVQGLLSPSYKSIAVNNNNNNNNNNEAR